MIYPVTLLQRKFQEQVAAGAGLAGNLVIWGSQSNDRPSAGYWVSLYTVSVTPLSQIAELQMSDNPDSTLGDGAELLFDTVEHIEYVYSINVFSAAAVGADGQASEFAHRIRGYLGRESVRVEFAGIKAAIIDRGPILHLPTVLNSKYESRASLDVRFRVSSGSSETNTYIETVNGSIELEDSVENREIDFSVTLDD